jgi:EAL domain-containing protein (putative c-di-GMP-specific phosphodiesterase class I)
MLALREPYLVSEHRLFNSASLGVVLFNDEAHSVDELMQRADLSMYSAKSAGKNALSFYDPLMQEMVSQRLQLEHDMRRGLSEGEFVLYLQPQMNHLGELQGVEALARWLHPQRGLLGPGMFIEIAERSGLIAELDLYIFKRGCHLLARWAAQPAFASLSLALNISSRLLFKDDFIAQVQRILAETQANPRQLKLEITESLLLSDKREAAQRMQALQALGIRFSIDDFGTGYSSMAYLQQLPLNQLKIDQSFVRVLPEISSLAIVRAIMALAHSLGLEVIAEGVETQAQWDVLRDNGCQFFQGYLFSQPVAVAVFESSYGVIQPLLCPE